MIEGSGSGSIHLTSGSGWPKNMWIRIRNTVFCACLFSGSGSNRSRVLMTKNLQLKLFVYFFLIDALPSPSYTIPPAQLLCQLMTASSSEPISADNQLYLLLSPAPEVNEPQLTAGSAHTPHHAAHTQLVASSLLQISVVEPEPEPEP